MLSADELAQARAAVEGHLVRSLALAGLRDIRVDPAIDIDGAGAWIRLSVVVDGHAVAMRRIVQVWSPDRNTPSPESEADFLFVALLEHLDQGPPPPVKRGRSNERLDGHCRRPESGVTASDG
ncbi:hypothetical protein [Microbacterium sp. K41]|uniref:hypothetical protein n=1 Tax=Microbacterium sp. K41 TaxID=2305437 RepID=UPI0014438FB2|nr:hypothetical protein [Microbacterium sp. K41]